MIQQSQNGGNVVSSKEVGYAYNAIGDVTARSAYNFVGVGPRYDIATSAISYNTLGLLTGISMTSDVGQVSLDNLTYSYDTLGRVSTLGSIDGTADYGYDKTSQLTSASYVAASGHVEPPNFTVTFDPNGTRTSANGVSTTVGKDNHLASDGTFTFAYDPAGNLTTRTRISSAAANDYKTVYLWDYRNRLTDVEFYNNSGTLTQHVHYVYDVWNNLIERDLDPSGSGTYTQIVHYVWDSPESQGAGGVVLAFNGADQLIARYLNGPNTSAYDQYYSTLVEEDVTSTSQGGTLTFPLLDQQGSVVDIADNNGNLADHIIYFSTGGVFTESHPSVPHIAGFQGGYIDVVTGMEKFGARWEYMADAFWASQDPIGLVGGINLTRIDSNDQPNATDQSGLFPGWPPIITPPPGAAPPPAALPAEAPAAAPAPAPAAKPAKAPAPTQAQIDAYNQALLDYYHRIMFELIVVGQELYERGPASLDEMRARGFRKYSLAPGCVTNAAGGGGKLVEVLPPDSVRTAKAQFPTDWIRLAFAISYATRNYKTMGFSGVQLRSGNSRNIGGLPGMYMRDALFYGDNEEAAVLELIHEPLHDFSQFGFGHGRMGQIVECVGTDPQGSSTWSRLLEFLRHLKNANGDSLWTQIVKQAGPRPMPPAGFVPPKAQ